MIPLGLFLLACLTFYVALVQTAFSVLLRLSIRLLAEREWAAHLVGRYLDEPVRLLLPARLLLGVAVVAATVLLGMEIRPTTLRADVTLLVAMGLWLTVFGYVLPWIVVRRFGAEAVVLALLPSFDLIIRPAQPLVHGVRVIVAHRRGSHARGGDQEESGPREHEPEGKREPSERERMSEREERKLLRSIVDFGDTLVREVMTPRPDVVAVRADATVDDLRALFREEEYSRFPVYADTLDNIVGIVYVKDLVLMSAEEGASRLVRSLMRPAYVVPETKRVADLLREFQRRQVQTAIVLDEYGGTAGLVTVEDLIEEIVGEIRDEYDVETEPIVEEAEGIFVVSAKVAVGEICDRLGVRIEREGFETVGGFLLSYLGRVPAVGEAFEVDGLHVEVLEAERRRVTKVRLRRLPAPEVAD